MRPHRDFDERVCPVCGQGLGPSPEVRRCSHCGARALWRRPDQDHSLPIVLFHARLCGIIAGVQLALIGLLIGDYHLPIPVEVILTMATLPILGYTAAGATAVRIEESRRAGYMTLLVAGNIGLLIAMIAGLSGMADPTALGAVGIAASAVVWPMISRSIHAWLDREEHPSA